MKLWRQRQTSNPQPHIPSSLQDYILIEVPDQYTNAADGGQFTVYKDWIDQDQTEPMVIFMSKWGFEILSNHETWLFDGTFESAPEPFSQIYIGMAASEIGGKGIPCIYGLLPNKKSSTYETMFKKVKELVGQESKLTTIITDFEKSVFGACRRVFPTINHKGCRFHHNAAVWRKLGELGLQSLFHQNALFQETLYKLYALCHVPEAEVLNFYQKVILPTVEEGLHGDQDWMDVAEKLEEFGFYYENTWIRRRGGREVPSQRLEPL